MYSERPEVYTKGLNMFFSNIAKKKKLKLSQ